MITEAIILAGGLGTRLRGVVGDLPKCMAPVNGIPFINFIVSYLKNEGIEKFIFSLGYRNEIIRDYLDKTFPNTDKSFVLEDEPLGTGGAIKTACKEVKAENVIIINGDTLFNINLAELSNAHKSCTAGCTIALKTMTSFSRYGTVEINRDKTIQAFHEKKYCENGLINGGIYALNVPDFLSQNLPRVFSFETEFLQKYVGTRNLYGLLFDNYFIDIGIPGDYKKFQQDYNLILAKKKYEDADWYGLEIISETFFGLLD